MTPGHIEQSIFLFNLFTEVAIVEHLVRNRLQGFVEPDLTPGQFGIISRFVRTGAPEESQAAMAWAFQDEEAYMAEKVDALLAKGYVTARAAEDGTDRLVSLTPDGAAAHAHAVERMAPEVEPLLEGLDIEDLKTTLATIRELRRTLDNLPDR